MFAVSLVITGFDLSNVFISCVELISLVVSSLFIVVDVFIVVSCLAVGYLLVTFDVYIVFIMFVESIVLVVVWLVSDDSSNVYVVCVVSFDSSNVCISSRLLVVCDSSNGFVWLVSDDSSNVFVCRLLVVLDLLVVYVMYVSMYEGRANYQYYALQGSE